MDTRRYLEVVNFLLGLQQKEESKEHPHQHSIGLLIDARVAVDATRDAKRAAAPEMYEALRDIIEQADRTKMMLPADLADAIRVFGREALDKADGK